MMDSNLPEMYKHQKDIVAMALEKDELALFHALGTGKTRSVIESLRALFNRDKKMYKTLIVGVPSVIYNWKNEILKFSNIHESKVYVCGSGTKRAEKLQEAIDRGVQIITINYEALISEKVFAVLMKWHAAILVCDESHCVKSNAAKRSKAVLSLSVGTSKRFILTGTPILRNMMDIFMQFKVLDHGKTFGANYFSFRARYFVDKNAAWAGKQKHFPLWVPREDTKQELLDKIKRKSHVVETKDCLDLPPRVDVMEFVEMQDDQKKAYNEMRDYFMTFVAENVNNPALATIAPVKALRLMQITAGHVTLDDGSVAVFGGNPKIKRLMELLEDLVPEHKVIIWTVFKQDVRSIETELLAAKIPYVKATGDETSLQKQQSVDAFQKEDSIRVFLGNARAAGTGLTITKASYSIRFSRNFNLGDELQSAARNYRAGSEMHEKIININLSVKDSIDEHVAKALACKEDIGKNVIEFVKQNA